MATTVGILDSGVGGLTVASALHRLLPALPIRYVADSAGFPYGDCAEAAVTTRVLAIAERLIAEGCGLLVVACNTASSAALEALRSRLAVPIVGMEPPLKPAVAGSARGHVAVLVTPATARGRRLARLAEEHAAGARVEIVPMPGLADLVEAGAVEGVEVEQALREALAGPLDRGIDAVALGCTHYGLVRPALARLLPAGVRALDAAEPVARRARQLLEEGGVLPAADAPPAEVGCATTGDPRALARTIERLRAAGAELPPLALAAEPFSLAGVAT
jgi:glutamate racemase